MPRNWPPKYFTIRDTLLLEIADGKYRDGIIGTESALCRRFGAGRNTIRHALRDMESIGCIERKQKVGIRILTRSGNPRKSSSGVRRIPVVLPYWAYVAGRDYQQIVRKIFAAPLPNGKTYLPEFMLSSDRRLDSFHDPEFILAIDPPQERWSLLERYAASGCRILAIAPFIDLPFAINLQGNHRKAALSCVELFLKNGRQNLGILTHFTGNQIYRRWLTGFLEAMTVCDLPVLPDAVCDTRMWRDYGAEAVHRFNGFLCTNRGFVEMLCGTAFHAGVSVPEDISLIGTDEPSGGSIPYFGKRLTVCRGATEKLAEMLKRIFSDPSAFPPGADVPMQPFAVIERETVVPVGEQHLAPLGTVHTHSR